MGFFQSLTVAVSGLSAQSTTLATLSDNIANINTPGYKKTAALFRDLVASENKAFYSPGGSAINTRSLNRKQGEIFLTNNSTDIAVSGNGFIPVRQDSATDGDIVYTRAGAFRPNQDGLFVNGAGFFLQAWPLTNELLSDELSAGEIDATTAIASLVTVDAGALLESFEPTSIVTLIGNLRASEDIYSGSPAYDASSALANMADGVIPPAFSNPFTVVDDTGAEHSILASFLKTGINTWAVELYVTDATELTSGNPQIAAGTLTFNGDGSIASISSGISTTITSSWTDPTGAGTSFTIDWGTEVDVGDGVFDGIIQVDRSYILDATQNGFATGSLESLSITEEGFVVGNYTNGLTRRLYQIPLAIFTEPNEMLAIAGTAFTAGSLSGDVLFSIANQSAAGNFVPGALESSNVDIETEMVEIIIAQRAYQANSKTLTVTNDMLDTLANL